MRSLFFASVALGLASAAAAQTAQPQPAPVPAPQAAKPQTVKKVVCQRVDDEETTGSRLSAAPKKCKTVEVPASGGSNAGRAPSSSPERGER